MIDPDIKSEWIRHAAGLGLFFTAVAILAIAWQLANIS